MSRMHEGRAMGMKAIEYYVFIMPMQELELEFFIFFWGGRLYTNWFLSLAERVAFTHQGICQSGAQGHFWYQDSDLGQ